MAAASVCRLGYRHLLLNVALVSLSLLPAAQGWVGPHISLSHTHGHRDSQVPFLRRRKHLLSAGVSMLEIFDAHCHLQIGSTPEEIYGLLKLEEGYPIASLRSAEHPDSSSGGVGHLGEASSSSHRVSLGLMSTCPSDWCAVSTLCSGREGRAFPAYGIHPWYFPSPQAHHLLELP